MLRCIVRKVSAQSENVTGPAHGAKHYDNSCECPPRVSSLAAAQGMVHASFRPECGSAHLRVSSIAGDAELYIQV